MTQKQVAVIGGGVIGVCTAYFLAEAGHEVVLIEKYGNVAEQASFGNAGVVAPGYVTPWAAPGMPKKLLSYLFKTEAPVLLKPTFDRALWRWVRMWLSECELNRYRTNRGRMQRIAFYSREVLSQLREHYNLDYEQTRGYLQLFRTADDLKLAEPALAMLTDNNIPHRKVDAETVREIEPALSQNTTFAGGIHLPNDESGNCPLFTKQLKTISTSLGVQFHFGSTAHNIQQIDNRLSFQIDDKTFSADAIVVAAGIDSVQLLEPLGIRIPMYPVKGYSATAAIRNFDDAPLSAIMDESYKVAIARMGSRIRIAGIAELGSRNKVLHQSALRTLLKVGQDWFPDATNYNTASFWCGVRPMMPDGPPLLGATPIPNLYLNVGHGSTGWAMAAGSGKILADLISGHSPDIDMDGLTLSRYR
jgi:D-amino-acid dehydrogenase